MTQAQVLKPGDRVRATIEATVVVADNYGAVLHTPQRLVARADENWTFDIIPRQPRVGDKIPRDDVNNYEWADGAVIRTTRPVHRAGGEWWFGQRGVVIVDCPAGTVFEVLAVGV